MNEASPRSSRIASLHALIARILDIDTADIVADSGIYRTQNWDSLAQINIILALEEMFEIEIPDDAIEHLTSVAEIEVFVAAQEENCI
ncbi:Acyl carrier protein [Candidatus Zixiibacteriota bacterium]|nr:Acyl carrier protein [candidate division Zixibacteria bacterium]